MIFNAHPRLYWGQYGANYDPSWLQIGVQQGRGYLRVGSLVVDTDGVLGRQVVNGRARSVAFPGWATLPSSYDLALARRWHLAFAWLFGGGVVAYLLTSLLNGHLWRDLLPRGRELRVAALWQEVKDHARLHFPAHGYNTLQKLAYVVVLLGLLPTMVLSGLTMSPGMVAAWPWLLDLFGGRQSARSIHFIVAVLLVLFVLVHLLMVLLAGPVRGIRAMVTGRSPEVQG